MDQSAYLKATTFVRPGSEKEEGDWSAEFRAHISKLRELYPELSHWGDLAIGIAFGDFSQDVFLVSWAEWMSAERDEAFLNFCCWVQTRGAWKDELNLELLATANEWKSANTN